MSLIFVQHLGGGIPHHSLALSFTSMIIASLVIYYIENYFVFFLYIIIFVIDGLDYEGAKKKST